MNLYLLLESDGTNGEVCHDIDDEMRSIGTGGPSMATAVDGYTYRYSGGYNTGGRLSPKFVGYIIEGG